MPRRTVYTWGWSTVTDEACFMVTNAPGGIVRRQVGKDLLSVMARVAAMAPVNNPLNAKRPGHHAPGLYRNSFYLTDPSTPTLTSLFWRAGNSAPHAYIVEKGHPYTRRRQVFSWSQARVSKPDGSGGFIQKPRPGGRVSTPHTHKWKSPQGHGLLRNYMRRWAISEGYKLMAWDDMDLA